MLNNVFVIFCYLIFNLSELYCIELKCINNLTLSSINLNHNQGFVTVKEFINSKHCKHEMKNEADEKQYKLKCLNRTQCIRTKKEKNPSLIVDIGREDWPVVIVTLSIRQKWFDKYNLNSASDFNDLFKVEIRNHIYHNENDRICFPYFNLTDNIPSQIDLYDDNQDVHFGYDNENRVHLLTFLCIYLHNFKPFKGRYVIVSLNNSKTHNKHKELELCRLKIVDLFEATDLNKTDKSCLNYIYINVNNKKFEISLEPKEKLFVDLVNDYLDAQRNSQTAPNPKSTQFRFGSWTAWSEYSEKCGLAGRIRTRPCFDVQLGDLVLPASDKRCLGNIETEFKGLKACPSVKSHLEQWSEWSYCHGVCYNQSSMNRYRTVCYGKWILSSNASKCIDQTIDTVDKYEDAIYCIYSLSSGKVLICDGKEVHEYENSICKNNRTQHMPPCICRTDWIENSASCYYVPSKNTTDGLLTANSAFEMCKLYGGFLATPYDARSALWLEDFAKKILNMSSNSIYKYSNNILFVGMKCENLTCQWLNTPGSQKIFANNTELSIEINPKMHHEATMCVYLREKKFQLIDCDTTLGLYACEIYHGEASKYFPSISKEHAKPI